ncbi:MAG: hypothetical protein AB1724_10050 [Thermodesulfobacteriota bacterium]
MNKTIEVPFGRWIEEGFSLYKANFKPLVLAAFIMIVLSSLTMFILLPPLTAGLILIILRIMDGETPPPGFGAVFNGFSFFLNALLFMLVWSGVCLLGMAVVGWFPVIGHLAAVFFSYALQALLVFGMFLIVDRKMGFWEASTVSMDTVKPGFWPFLGLTIVASVIGGIGAIAFGVGIALTLPIGFCILAAAYRDIFKKPDSAPEEPMLEIPR